MKRKNIDYPIRQKKYAIISVICIIIALSTLILDMTLKPHLEASIETTFDPTPYLIYTIVVPPLAYMAMGILIPASVSLGVDLRFSTGTRVTVLIIGAMLFLVYLFVAVATFTGLSSFPALLTLYKVLYYDFLPETQKLITSLFGLSVFLFFNK